ncbi:MAG: transposase [Verrucomicrobiota bacterium]|nr:transposase [Verrucomicrobiota bacterium]
MARPLRIEYAGAIYHALSRGDRREAIFRDEVDRKECLRLLGEVCGKTGWQVHAYCLLNNHFHLVLETPQPNLSVGMKWFLGTYTQRFNRRHRLSGHLFQGRYKAQLIDERSGDYLRAACDYVHLNPVRAGVVGPEEKLEIYRWSSYVAYRDPKERPSWLRIDRLFGEHGLMKDTATSRREFERRLAAARGRAEGVEEEQLRQGWKLGAEDFADWLAGKLARAGRSGERARERVETDTALAHRLVEEALAVARWSELDLAREPKGHPVKVEIARQLRHQTPMSRQWIAQRLRMGSPSYVSTLLSSVDSKL